MGVNYVQTIGWTRLQWAHLILKAPAFHVYTGRPWHDTVYLCVFGLRVGPHLISHAACPVTGLTVPLATQCALQHAEAMSGPAGRRAHVTMNTTSANRPSSQRLPRPRRAKGGRGRW